MTGPVPLGEPLLTPQEAARLLRLPPSTVYDLARRDVLPHIRIGRAIRFSRRISRSSSVGTVASLERLAL